MLCFLCIVAFVCLYISVHTALHHLPFLPFILITTSLSRVTEFCTFNHGRRIFSLQDYSFDGLCTSKLLPVDCSNCSDVYCPWNYEYHPWGALVIYWCIVCFSSYQVKQAACFGTSNFTHISSTFWANKSLSTPISNWDLDSPYPKQWAMAFWDFYQSIKALSTSIQTHIDVFTTLLQDLNYNLDALLSDFDVNIAFLASLNSSWQAFQQSIGERISALKSAVLYAEVLAFEMQKARAETVEKTIGERIANFTTRRGNRRIDMWQGGFPW